MQNPGRKLLPEFVAQEAHAAGVVLMGRLVGQGAGSSWPEGPASALSLSSSLESLVC